MHNSSEYQKCVTVKIRFTKKKNGLQQKHRIELFNCVFLLNSVRY